MRNRTGLLAVVALALVPVLPVLPRLGSAWFGLAGVGRGEFETWWWLHWWIGRLLEFHAEAASGLPDLAWRVLSIPRVLDIGNMADVVLLSLPLEALVGAPAFHNLKILLVLAGNAAAAWWLVRGLRPEEEAPGAATAGAALGLALSPFLWTEVQESRMGQALLAFAWLGAGAWLRLLREPSPRRAVAFGLLLGATAVFYWFYGLWLALWCLFSLPAARRPGGALPRPGTLALAVVTALALALPFAAPYLVGGSNSPVPLGQPFPPLEGLPRLPEGQLGPIGPALILAQSLPPGWLLDPAQAHGASLAWLALALLGAWRGGPRARLWLLPAAAFWLLSLGPYLRLGDDYAAVPLPYGWLYQWLPAWSRLNWPWRVAPFVFLSLAPLVLEGLRCLPRPRLAAVLAGGLVLGELALRGTLFLTASPVPVSPFYEGLGPEEGVVELSFPWNSSMAGMLQAFHGRPTLGTQAQFWPHAGHPPEEPWSDPRRFATEPFPAWLSRLREGPAGPPPDDGSALARAGYRWVVVHLDVAGGLALAARVEEALGPADYADPTLEAWKLEAGRTSPPPSPR